MDDFILLLDTKQECIEALSKIKQFIEKNLRLELNNKSMYYPNQMGLNFCGYRIFTTHKLLRTNSKKKIKKKVRKWNLLYSQNKLDIKRTMMSLNSWKGHANHCDSYKLQEKILNSCNFLYNANTFKTIENNYIYDIENWKDYI